MEPVRPRFVPDPALSREAMEAIQREIAAEATFADEFGFDPGAVAVREPTDPPPGGSGPLGVPADGGSGPVVAGIDQAFLDDRAVSAIVAFRGGRVVERAHAVAPLAVPYVPGLLAFREGGAVLEALAALSAEPDLLVLDGSGRIHFRQAGIATHVGVACDVPAVGVAKSLLCGEPDEPADGRPEGWSTPVRADGEVEAPEGTVLGHAYQSRQYPNSRRVNPLYVSPGHRVSAETTVELVEALCAGYKLPEPTRLADRYADEVARSPDG